MKSRRGVLIVIAGIATMLAACPRERTQADISADVIAERMHKATEARQYDEAVAMASEALKRDPSNGLLLSQVGLVYLRRGAEEPKQREKWLTTATEYAERTMVAT